VRLRGGWLVVLVVAMAACSNPLARQYEYDEQTYLDIDGSATVVIAASVPALVGLRGLALDPAPNSRIDSAVVRDAFESAGCEVENVTRPWRRAGRRFVQVRLAVDDVNLAGRCAPLAWSTYTFARTDEQLVYQQIVGAAAGAPPSTATWRGDELVVFKLHLPSKVLDHNVRRLSDNEPGTIERGNILAWEQRLTDRFAGRPIDMRVVTEPESILYQTMFLFAGAFAAAVLALLTIIWFVIRRGRARLKELQR
jgi:hypothetical protein